MKQRRFKPKTLHGEESNIAIEILEKLMIR